MEFVLNALNMLECRDEQFKSYYGISLTLSKEICLSTIYWNLSSD